MTVGRHPGWCAAAHSDRIHVGASVRCWSTAETSIHTWIEQRENDPTPMVVISILDGAGVNLIRLPLDQAVSMHVGLRACLTRTGGHQ